MKDAKMDFKRIPVYILFVLMPLLTALFLCLCYRVDPRAAIPVWNDEISWFCQVRSAAAFGGPLGYYGYNGGHAAIGTFGAWGPFMVWAMSPVAAVTGMELLTPVYTNLLFSCLANFFFLLFTRPSFRSTLKMLLASCFFYTSFNYILTSMSETTRFSLGIVLAAMLWYLWTQAKEGSVIYNIILYLLAPLYILFCVSCYILFALAVPVWFLCLGRRLTAGSGRGKLFWFLYVLLSLVLSLGVIAVCFYIRMKTSASYNVSLTGSLVSSLGSEGPAAILPFLKARLKPAWETISPMALIRGRSEHFGSYMFYLLTCYALILFLCYRILRCIDKNYRCRDCLPQYLAALYMLTGFLAAFILLYTTVLPTLIRGLNIAFVPAVLLLCLGEEDTIVSQRLSVLLLIGLIGFIPNFRASILEDRFDSERTALIKSQAELFEQYIQVEKGKTAEENTIALYGHMTNHLLGIPAGAGINCYLDGSLADAYGYAVLNLEAPGTLDMTAISDGLAGKGYQELYRDDHLVILQLR